VTESELAAMAEQAALSLEALPDHTAHYALAEAVSRLVPEVRRLRNILDALPPWDRCPWCGADSPWINGFGDRGGGCGPECPNPTVGVYADHG
jgi:hypothetical protein